MCIEMYLKELNHNLKYDLVSKFTGRYLKAHDSLSNYIVSGEVYKDLFCFGIDCVISYLFVLVS